MPAFPNNKTKYFGNKINLKKCIQTHVLLNTKDTVLIFFVFLIIE